MSRDAPRLQRSLFSLAEALTFYEQPLNERTRSFLRLEHLFTSVDAALEGSSEWASRAGIGGLIEITDLLSRSDIKAELIKELERQAAVLAPLQKNPAVDVRRLEQVLGRLADLLAVLKTPGCQPGQTLRQDELVTSIRQRIAIPGGACNFDLPGLHHWLSRPAEHRLTRLQHWYEDLRVVRDATALCLGMIRDSASPSPQIAVRGFYNQNIDPNQPCQIIRVGVAAQAAWYPEVSGGKHRFTIRFLEQPLTTQRPAQVEVDVEFDLQCCVL